MSRSLLCSLVTCTALVSACGAPQPQPPTPPANLMAMVMGSGLMLTWEDTFTTETGFEIQRKSDGEFTTLVRKAANDVSHHDTGVTPGVNYSYRVRAVIDDVNGAWSSEASGSVPVPEPTLDPRPTGLAAMPMSGMNEVRWVNNATDATGYELQRKDPGADFATIATISSKSTTSRMDSNVTAGATYTYRVRALRPGGPTDWSDTLDASL